MSKRGSYLGGSTITGPDWFSSSPPRGRFLPTATAAGVRFGDKLKSERESWSTTNHPSLLLSADELEAVVGRKRAVKAPQPRKKREKKL